MSSVRFYALSEFHEMLKKRVTGLVLFVVYFFRSFWIVVVPLWGLVNIENGEWPVVRSDCKTGLCFV